MQNWIIHRMERQIESPAKLQITAPPEGRFRGSFVSKQPRIASTVQAGSTRVSVTNGHKLSNCNFKRFLTFAIQQVNKKSYACHVHKVTHSVYIQIYSNNFAL